MAPWRSLSDVLVAVPERYGTVGAFLRVFVPRPGDEQFAERMTVRFSALAPINDPASLYKPIRKVVHRGHPEIRLTRGNHALVGQPVRAIPWLVPGRGLPLPAALAEQSEAQGASFRERLREVRARPPTAYHADMFAALQRRADRRVLREAGRVRRGAGAGVANGRLVVDTRLRDALRQLGDDGGRAAADAAAHVPAPDARGRCGVRGGSSRARRSGRGAVAAATRRGSSAGSRLELRLPKRVYRKVSRTAKRALGR